MELATLISHGCRMLETFDRPEPLAHIVRVLAHCAELALVAADRVRTVAVSAHILRGDDRFAAAPIFVEVLPLSVQQYVAAPLPLPMHNASQNRRTHSN